MISLNDKEAAAFAQAFRNADKKRTGTIPTSALRSVFEGLGYSITKEQLFIMTADADVEGSGVIDFEEFMNCCLRWKQQQRTPGPRITVEAFDALAEDGHLSPEKVAATLSEFDLDLKIQDVMSSKKIALLNGQGLSKDQFQQLLS